MPETQQHSIDFVLIATATTPAAEWERPVYFVTRSSHLTMASMANIEMAQTMTKMLHVAEIEMRL